MTSTLLWQRTCAGRLVSETVNGVQRVQCYEELPGTRVREGLQVLYAFDEDFLGDLIEVEESDDLSEFPQ